MLFVLLGILLLTGCASEGNEPSPATVSAHPNWDSVDAQALREVAMMGNQHILLIGDSLTMGNPIMELCGLPVIHAGYSGATWQDVAARPIWGQIRSARAVVLLGTNNATLGIDAPMSMMQEFIGLVQATQLWVETMPPFYRPDYVTPEHEALRVQIQNQVLNLGFPVIDTRTVMDDPSLYVDGVHWTARGYTVQNQELKNALCP
jgi:GDSL-like Lipase/Acylhydrolase family